LLVFVGTLMFPVTLKAPAPILTTPVLLPVLEIAEMLKLPHEAAPAATSSSPLPETADIAISPDTVRVPPADKVTPTVP